jgi:hypothetical protein
MRMLIAFPRREHELADALEDEVRNRAGHAKGDDADTRVDLITQVTTAQSAKEAVANTRFNVILVHEHLPETNDAVPRLTGGIDLITWLQTNKIMTPVGLLHSKITWQDAEVAQLARLKNVRLIRHSLDSIAQLAHYGLTAKGPAAHLDITLDFTECPDRWKYRISGEGFPVSFSEGLLRLRSDEIEVLKWQSREIDSEGEDLPERQPWEEHLKMLSENLWGCLVEGQSQFSRELTSALDKVDRIENTRLRFRISPEHYGVAFEAIRHPKRVSPSPYWMLGAPVYRTLGPGMDSDVAPLFDETEPRPLNCLVILADAVGTATYSVADRPSKKRRYEKLPCGAAECEGVRETLERRREQNVNIGAVLLTGVQHPVSIESLRELLTPDPSDYGRRWDLIHFTGHTDFIDDQAYFILPGKAAGQVQSVPVKDLVPLFGNARFVYLSSCTSASAAFVLRLAQHGTRGILGFRTKIADSLAVAHATQFYTQLFKTRCIEEAFLNTRRHFYKKEPGSRVWASALVVLQK